MARCRAPKRSPPACRCARPQASGSPFAIASRSTSPTSRRTRPSRAPGTRRRRADQRRLAGPARSYLAVPIMVKDQPIGILRLTHNEPGRFTAEHARLATAIANQAAIAIENARLYQQAQEFAVLEERQRLARDLHDSVSQALFGVVMATHSALHELGEEACACARPRGSRRTRLAKTAQAEMRALIFELRPDQLETDGLVKALELQTTALQQRAPVPARRGAVRGAAAPAAGEGGVLPDRARGHQQRAEACQADPHGGEPRPRTTERSRCK